MRRLRETERAIEISSVWGIMGEVIEDEKDASRRRSRLRGLDGALSFLLLGLLTGFGWMSFW